MKSILTLTFFCMIAVISCTEPKDNEPLDPELVLPEVLPDPGAINGHFELGRALFYDKSLSADNSVSCASCHKQEFAFSDNARFSTGIYGALSTRNSMPLQNFSQGHPMSPDLPPHEMDSSSSPMFWDGREESLVKMILNPITDPSEMGMSSLENVIQKVSSIDYYRNAFHQFYGADEITEEDLSLALQEFVVSLRSGQTKFDRFLQEVAFDTLNNGQGILDSLEVAGKDLFFEKYDCNACHQVEDPTGYLTNPTGNEGFSNIGLDATNEDKGRAVATANPSDEGKFKIPSLRNVALTAPYMHDGRFETLDDVIDHYSTDIKTNPNLDRELRSETGEPMQFHITDAEKTAIIAFLHTLTDESFISNEEFSDPFVE